MCRCRHVSGAAGVCLGGAPFSVTPQSSSDAPPAPFTESAPAGAASTPVAVEAGAVLQAARDLAEAVVADVLVHTPLASSALEAPTGAGGPSSVASIAPGGLEPVEDATGDHASAASSAADKAVPAASDDVASENGAPAASAPDVDATQTSMDAMSAAPTTEDPTTPSAPASGDAAATSGDATPASGDALGAPVEASTQAAPVEDAAMATWLALQRRKAAAASSEDKPKTGGGKKGGAGGGKKGGGNGSK